MRLPVISSVALLLLTSPLRAQELRDRLTELFMLGTWTAPLQVAAPSGTGDAVAVVPNDAFAPAAVQANATVLGFLLNWMSGNVAAVPLGTALGGVSFSFEGGIPTRTAVAPGPVLGERAQTLGRGRLVVGANVTGLQFTSVRGVPLGDVRLNFTHVNVDSPECDAAEGRDCSPLGVPAVENDIVEFRLGVDLDLTVAALSLTYGVTDFLDIGAVLPLVHADLNGNSRAQVIPFSSLPNGQPQTFIGGTPANPILESAQSVEGSATGIGDVGARMKVRLIARDQTNLALLGDVRFPTGNEGDFLGAGHTATRALGIFSTQLGGFSPFASVGYLAWSGEVVNDAVLGTIGFDQAVAPWVAVAASFVSEFQVGESVYQLPDPVTITEPFTRIVRPAEIPDIRDNAFSIGLGAKFLHGSGITALVNALVPVKRGGPRPDFAWTVGVEYDF